MRSLLTIMISVIWMGTSFDAVSQDTNTPIVSNYQEVLSTIEYPSQCRENGVEGTVKVTIHLDRTGNITHHKVTSSPCSDLTRAVEAKISNFEFEAPLVNGEPVSSKVVIPIVFELSI